MGYIIHKNMKEEEKLLKFLPSKNKEELEANIKGDYSK